MSSNLILDERRMRLTLTDLQEQKWQNNPLPPPKKEMHELQGRWEKWEVSHQDQQQPFTLVTSPEAAPSGSEILK